jgi:hypothetical protein
VNAQNKRAGTVAAVPNPNNRKPKQRKPNPRPEQRQYKEGWSRRVELLGPRVMDVDEFLDIWGHAIVALNDNLAVDEDELSKEADGWARALHARKAAR